MPTNRSQNRLNLDEYGSPTQPQPIKPKTIFPHVLSDAPVYLYTRYEKKKEMLRNFQHVESAE